MSILKYGFTLFFFVGFIFSNQAQDENLEFIDKVYVDYIHTVQLDPTTDLYKDPIIELGSDQTFLFSFDDFSEDTRSYVYTIQHCNADWTPSDLTSLDYIEGLMEGDIEEYTFSINTLTPYTHHSLILPNDELAWTLPGNYILKIYDDDNRKLVITRRFMISELPGVIISPTFISATGNFRTHQEINFDVFYSNLKVDNPRQEINVIIKQNRRWDNAIFANQPRSEKRQTLIYNTRGKFSFGGGKEFRFLDLRSVEHTRRNISQIIEGTDTYDITLFSDEIRSDRSFLRQFDMNGDFIIENSDQSNRDPNIRSDYADVLFTLKLNQELEDYDVYLSGQFNNWQPDPRYKMVYNDIIHAYVAKPKLKQGVYDYSYTVVPKTGGSEMDFTELEGNWYETENDYSILVYFRPFGGRYDRLIGVKEFNIIDKNSVNNR